MDRSIITQTAVQPVTFGLNEVSSNLADHENATLSKAHGLNMLEMVAGSADGAGNLVDKYYDNVGNAIGDFFLVFTVNNKIYYAPANNSTLAGQAPSVGLGEYEDQTGLTVSERGGIAWITDITSDELPALNAINDEILLSHIKKGYWETHGLVTVVEVPTGIFDSLGYCIGHAKALLNYEGITYEIPCDPRLGGPKQQPRIIGFNPPSPFYHSSPAGGEPTEYFPISVIVGGGFQPLTFSYEYWQSGNWHAFGPAETTVPWVGGHDGGPATRYSATTGLIEFRNNAPGGDDFDYVRVRLTVSNDEGSTYRNQDGAELVYDFQVQDHAPCCWFCSEANKTQRVPPEDWQLIGLVEQEVYRIAPRPLASYVKHGDRLVKKMLEAGVAPGYFVEFTQTIIRMAKEGRAKEAAIYYVDFVAKACRRYWPDTKLRGFVHHLSRLVPE